MLNIQTVYLVTVLAPSVFIFPNGEMSIPCAYPSKNPSVSATCADGKQIHHRMLISREFRMTFSAST